MLRLPARMKCRQACGKEMKQLDSLPWPDGCAGAVSLTFDDGHQSHLDCVVPLLAEFGLHATFYVNPRGDNEAEWRARLLPWRAVQAAGHEVGNHSLSHTCSRALRTEVESSRPALEEWTLADVEADVVEAERRLQAVLPLPPGRRRSFCYPCYHEHVGEGPTRQSYVPVIARHFIAGRGLGEFPGNHPATCDLHYLWSWPVEMVSTDRLRQQIVEPRLPGAWIIITMHGIGSLRRHHTEADLRRLCSFLQERRQRLWIAPVATVAQRVVAWRAQRKDGG